MSKIEEKRRLARIAAAVNWLKELDAFVRDWYEVIEAAADGEVSEDDLRLINDAMLRLRSDLDARYRETLDRTTQRRIATQRYRAKNPDKVREWNREAQKRYRAKQKGAATS